MNTEQQACVNDWKLSVGETVTVVLRVGPEKNNQRCNYTDPTQGVINYISRSGIETANIGYWWRNILTDPKNHLSVKFLTQHSSINGLRKKFTLIVM